MIQSHFRRSHRILAGAVITVISLSGCGGAPDDETVTAQDAPSVTQEAPSVWATAPTDAPVAASAQDDLMSGQESLPGLSEECSDAIRAQAAVNELIGRALREATRQIGEQDVDQPSEEFTPVLTDAEVADTFGRISELVPVALTEDFAALRDAAEQVTKATPTQIPDVMEESAVTGAIAAISGYIADCQPVVDEDE